jgi:Uma2 family endonuclease
MADTTAHPITVAELGQLPDSEPFRYELRHGILIKEPRPKARHYKLQRRLRQVLERAAGETGIVPESSPSS